MGRSRSAALLALVCVALAAQPALARKRHAAASDICFSTHLSSQDQSDCKKQIANAKTADERAKVRKVYQQKVRAATSSTPAPSQPAAPAAN